MQATEVTGAEGGAITFRWADLAQNVAIDSGSPVED